MATLHEISSIYRLVLDEAYNEEEISDGIWLRLKNLDEKFDDKISSMSNVVWELSTNCQRLGEEVTRMTGRLKRWEKNLQAIKNYMLAEMAYVGKEKVKTPIYDVRICKRQAVEPDDLLIEELENKELHDLIRTVPEKKEPDKKAIKEYIQAGNTLQHAKLVDRTSLVLR